MDIQSWNFWLGFIATCGFVAGFVIAVIKTYHSAVARLIRKKLEEGNRKAQLDKLAMRFTELETDLKTIRKDITPNGKNTQRLGDIAARTEQKVDNLIDFMGRYAEKVDQLEREMSEHLGYHNGADL